jgi:NADPH-dependent 2,4-dienoyl-CoA reductase/sulfur reductase-like enzyme
MTDAAGVVVVGGGLAAVTVARELRASGFTAPVRVLSDETQPPYDRPPLSKQLLAGALTVADVALFRPGELDELGVELILGCRVTALDAAAREVTAADGARYRFDTAVIATGARPRVLGFIRALPGVHYLRSLGQSIALRAALRESRDVVIIGAGFIGLEVAAVARTMGCAVTVVEVARAPLTRVLGDAGAIVTALHAAHGVEVRCGATVGDVVGEEVVGGLVVDGEVVPADLVLVGVGAVPNSEWLAGSGIEVCDGVVCDASGHASLANIYAAGDVSRWCNLTTGRHARVEQWQSALEQATVVARAIAQPDQACAWTGVPYFWSDQYDRKLQLVGAAGNQVHTATTSRGPVVCFGEAGVLTGVLTMGNPRAAARGRQLVGAGTSLAAATEWADAL